MRIDILSYDFNPRARVGRDGTFSGNNVGYTISIHAPAWGATVDAGPRRTVRVFQSTRPRGARPFPIDSDDLVAAFQSTRPRGARHRRSRGWTASEYFNPRARVGRDCFHPFAIRSLCISIHAPAWGATFRCYQYSTDFCISIHAPAWGATIRLRRSIAADEISIHAPAWGATMIHRFDIPQRLISIHAPAWGATQALVVAVVDNAISIHAPAWGATVGYLKAEERKKISIHAPAWGATICESIRSLSSAFQSTRPRGARRTQ